MARRDLLLLGGAAAAVGIGRAVRDYRAWVALGPGGLPVSWTGWWRTTRWRMAKRDPLAPVAAAPGRADIALLAHLPPRAGSRPRVAPHPVPHRQIEQHAPASLIPELEEWFEQAARTDPERLCYVPSHFEKRHRAVTLREACRCHHDALGAHGEVGHVHPSDGSMHMILSPSDARTVIERGWGERHGLAGVRLGLPPTYTMIYAPRTRAEIATITSILDAAIGYMSLGPDRGTAPANRA